MDFRWGTMMSLRTVMKPHMKNSVVTIVNAREFVVGPATTADVSDVGDMRFLLPNSPSDVSLGEESAYHSRQDCLVTMLVEVSVRRAIDGFIPWPHGGPR